MNPFDAVLKITTRPIVKRASVTLVAGVTAGVLFFSPAISVVASGGATHPATSVSVRYQDDDESKIVPRESDDGSDDDVAEPADENEESDVVVIQYDTNDDEDSSEPADEKDDPESSGSSSDGDDSSTRPLKLTEIISSKVDIAPSQWAGVFDSRLIAPFMVAPKPERLSSEAISLNAPVTPREIVGGQMQTPKDEFEVSWYKETASPGQDGNMVFAGHLNWYGVPQAIFYNINAFSKGDEIVVTGEDGVDYTYKVKWVKLIETADADLDELVGETKKPSLTLITCGGEWDPAAAQYKQRTVVRAELVVEK